jgi:hypothetical protein
VAASLSPSGTPAAAPAAARLADLVTLSWRRLDPVLSDSATDPAAVLPYLHDDTVTFYWELHFQDGRRTRTDFLHRAPLDLGDAASRSPDPIVARLAAWRAAPETAQRCHPTAWLELDGPVTEETALRRPRVQGVSVCLDPDIGTGRRRAPSLTTASALRFFSGLQGACGAPARGASTLRRVHEAARDAEGTLRHLSIMRGRAGQPAKIYAAIPKPALSVFLSDAGWPGRRADANRLAALVCAESDRVTLDLQLENDLAPRIGFELFFDPSPARDPLRRTATSLARRLGVLSADQVAGLERWVGVSRRCLGNDVWPTTVQRWFDLKFVSSPEEPLEVKAYLGFRLCQGIF